MKGETCAPLADRLAELLSELIDARLDARQRHPSAATPLHAARAEVDGLLSIDGAAEWLDVSTRTVQRLIADGELDPIRVQSHRRIPVEQLRAYVNRQQQAAQPRLRAVRGNQ